MKIGHQKNLDTLASAFASNAACLVECTRKADGATVIMLCTYEYADNGDVYITPFAEMVSGNPYEQYRPTAPIEEELASGHLN